MSKLVICHQIRERI